MLYLQLKSRVTASPGQKLKVGDFADALGDKSAEALKCAVPVNTAPGVWKVPSAAILKAVLPLKETVTLLNGEEVILHVTESEKKKHEKLRAAAAFVILFFGSALAITWFHADVDMLSAQQSFFRLIAGREPHHQLLITVPYVLGVGLGVGMYYALFSRKRAASPLVMKLEEYCRKTEQTAGRIP